MSKKAMKLALEALENMTKIRDCQREQGYPLSDADKRMQIAIKALEEALAKQEQGEHLAMQVRPSEFAELIKGKETVAGIPAYWAEWPNKEKP